MMRACIVLVTAATISLLNAGCASTARQGCTPDEGELKYLSMKKVKELFEGTVPTSLIIDDPLILKHQDGYTLIYHFDLHAPEGYVLLDPDEVVVFLDRCAIKVVNGYVGPDYLLLTK